MPVAQADIPKAAIVAPFGLFEFLSMPFGICNAAQTFQRLMDQNLCHFGFCFVYLDDIIVASRNMKEHLHQLLSVLSSNGLVPCVCSGVCRVLGP